MTTTDPAPAALEPPIAPFASYDIDADVVATAVRHAIAATEAEPVGAYASAFLVPSGYQLTIVDHREHYDPEPDHHHDISHRFVGVESIAAYVNRFKTDTTLGYVNDLTGRGTVVLVNDVTAATYVIDEHAPDATAFRSHTAELVLRPTAAARRWGRALAAKTIDQETLLDLVVDGITEIAVPDGATLRDLVADLHAIRTTSARSVIRTGGQATVETADNVTLHAGTGNQLTVPEQITVVFQPYAGVDTEIVLPITVKPRITATGAVQFTLDAPALDVQIATTLSIVRAHLDTLTDVTSMWVP